MKRLLVANRGEIAVRIIRAARVLGVQTVAVFSEDDAASLHVRRADAAHKLDGVGAAAYLAIDGLMAAAKATGCDAMHPGYGFRSESPELARRAAAERITFVGPRAEVLEQLGDKIRARAVAQSCGVPVLRGSDRPVTAAEARDFLAALGPGGAMMLKAVAGGGGRGIRIVRTAADVAAAYERCRSEALQSFGRADLYVEELLPRARHIEVQIVGDRSGRVTHLGERECTMQRRHQKLVEIAPSPSLPNRLRERIVAAGIRLGEAVGYENAGTCEFLVDADGGDDARYAFIEINPRLQVEHTVTEAVLGIDLAGAQLRLASGESLAAIGFDPAAMPPPRGFAIQVRVNAETIQPDGSTRPSSGSLTVCEWPAGPGVRVDTAAYAGYRTNPNFDSLLAKIIVHSPSPHFADVVARVSSALAEVDVAGVRTNVPFLQRLIGHPEFAANRLHTGFIDEHAADLLVANDEVSSPSSSGALVGAAINPADPLAVLAYGKGEGVAAGVGLAQQRDVQRLHTDDSDDAVVLRAPMQGTVVSIGVTAGDAVCAGDALLVMTAMKMEHVLEAPASGIVQRVTVATGDTVPEGHALVVIEPAEVAAAASSDQTGFDLDRIREDLAEVQRRHDVTLDAARPDAVERRRKTHQQTARENIAALCDPDTFIEYGALAIAAQRQRRAVAELIERTPADGLVAGIGRVNGDLFAGPEAQCMVLAYDYTVLAGTQGLLNHRKKDRMFELAERLRIPVVFFTEGGGGRPGDTDASAVASLDCMAFHLFGKLSGLVPLVGINSGRCFAGNAALLGCCDVVIATAGSNIGMGGPAMIEGGGLGVFRPEEVGPMQVQVPNGVVDIAVRDEAHAVQLAKQYLSYFQGPLENWECADQRRLRAVIPEQRLRVYEVRSVVETLADAGSVLELRPHFGIGMVTALIRIEGRPLGVIANNPKHLAGAIDSPGADKAARFMQLCDAFDLPILFLCDTPGIMVGPEVEKTALVRHCCRMFVVGSNLTVPFFTIILRKSYGLGAQAMGGGSHKAPVFTVAWPTGEFGGMGLEGAVKLGFRKELAGIEDAAERQRVFEHMVGRAYEHGKALNTATHFEIDDVIDPAASRSWIVSALRASPTPPPRRHKKRPGIDPW